MSKRIDFIFSSSRRSSVAIFLLFEISLVSCNGRSMSFGSTTRSFIEQKTSETLTEEDSQSSSKYTSFFKGREDETDHEKIGLFFDALHGPNGQEMWDKATKISLKEFFGLAIKIVKNDPISLIGYSFENMKDFIIDHQGDLDDLSTSVDSLGDFLTSLGVESRLDVDMKGFQHGIKKSKRIISNWDKSRKNQKVFDAENLLFLIQDQMQEANKGLSKGESVGIAVATAVATVIVAPIGEAALAAEVATGALRVFARITI